MIRATNPALKLSLIALAAMVPVGGAMVINQLRFRPVVGETQIETPTPKQVSRGYDAVVHVTIEARGRRPEWLAESGIIKQISYDQTAKLILEGNGHSEIIPLRNFVYTFWRKRDEHFEVKYPLKLTQLPAGKVRLQDRVALFRNETQSSGSVSYTGEPKQISQPLELDVLVRPNGVTQPPEVSRDPKIQVLSVESRTALAGETDRIRTLTPGETDRSKPINAVARLILADTPTSKSWDVRQFDVVDSSGTKVDAKCVAHFEDFSVLNTRQPLKLMVQWPNVPPEKGRLFILGRIYLDDNWPLQIYIPIRDEAGEAIALAATMPDKATGVKIEPAPRQS